MSEAPAMSLAAFEEHLSRAGLKVSPEKARELYPYLAHLEAMTARMRAGFTYADEPAHVFSAKRGAPK